MSKIPSGLKCEITVQQAYPNGVPEVPDGWEFDGFRSAKEGECYLPSAKSASIVHTASGDHAEVYPLIIVRRKPEPPPKPPTCVSSIVHGHCCCKNRCCYCHYEVGKPGKNLQWVVEFPYDEPAGTTPDGLLQQATFRVVRQVKPITREEPLRAYSSLVPLTGSNVVCFLRKLGIAVED